MYHQEYARKHQTLISLQRLMKTGQGEFLEKNYKTPAFLGRLGRRLAAERILMQASSCVFVELLL